MLHISADEQKARLTERLANPDKHWKYNPGDLDERAHWAAYRDAYEIALERTNTDAAPWHVVPSDKKWFRNLAVGQLLLETLRGLDLQWPKADFDVAPRPPGSTRSPRSSDHHRPARRHRHPLRHPAARGRQPARSRRGRRPRHLRLQVPRRRPGSEGPGRGGRSSASSRPGSGCVPRGWWSSTSTPSSRATRPTRRCRTCSTRASGPTSASTSCRAPSAYDGQVAAADDEGAGGALAGRLHRQRRPLLAQPQPADLARRPLGHRPRRLPLLPPRLARGRHRPGEVRARSRGTSTATCSTYARTPRARLDRAICAALDREVLSTCSPQVPGRLARAGARRRDAGRAARRRTSTSSPPGSAPASGCRRRAMRPDPLAYQYVVLRCVPRPDREEFLNVGVVLHCQAADFLDVAWNVDADRLRALHPGSTSTRSARHSPSSTGCAAATSGRRGRRQSLGTAVRLPQGAAQHRPPARAGPRRRHRGPGAPARAPARAPRRTEQAG